GRPLALRAQSRRGRGRRAAQDLLRVEGIALARRLGAGLEARPGQARDGREVVSELSLVARALGEEVGQSLNPNLQGAERGGGLAALGLELGQERQDLLGRRHALSGRHLLDGFPLWLEGRERLGAGREGRSPAL